MGFFVMKNILKVVFVIIGTMIGAGFASRSRDVPVFLFLWNRRNDRSSNSKSNYGNCHLSNF